jgi:uncharacterized protein YcnI
MRTITKAGALAATVALALPVAAQAHVTAAPSELPADGYSKVTLSVPHGCEESPTTRVRVQMPDEVQSATPQVVPGWKITTTEGKLPKPYDSHGDQITEGVREITWSGGRLDAHQLEEFGISVKLAGEPGSKIFFKTLQTCEEGSHAWAEIPVEGEEEPEEPAPEVTLIDETAGATATGDDEIATAPASAPTGDDGDDGLAIAALIVGGLGFVAGIAGLLAGRRARNERTRTSNVATQP